MSNPLGSDNLTKKIRKDIKKSKIKLLYDKEIEGWFKDRKNDFIGSCILAGVKCEIRLKQGKITKFYRNY